MVKCPSFCTWHFEINFLECKHIHFHWNFTEICCQGFIWQWQWVSMGSENGLAPYRWQAINWTNSGLVKWHILVLLGLCESIKMYILLREYLDGWQRQSTALTHLHLRREAYPAWYMDTDPCIIPTDPCWMPLRGILCGPLLRPPGLWPAVARGYL